MSSKVQESTDFVALDACHEQTKSHLIDLLAMLQQMMNSGIDGEVQAKAAKIEEFFSGASRKHHLDEERNVFPPLLDSGDAELIAAVRTMQQDHGWIEENWLETTHESTDRIRHIIWEIDMTNSILHYCFNSDRASWRSGGN